MAKPRPLKAKAKFGPAPMAEEDYRRLDAANFSTLKFLADSPLAYRAILDEPPPDSDRFVAGRAGHTAVLEPVEFLRRYILWEGGRRAGAEWERFAEANSGKTILKPEEYDRAVAIGEAVKRHPVAAPLLAGARVEHVVTWTDEETGIVCKARIDAFTPAALVEVKTCATADRREFGRSAARYRYHAQIAFYRAGLAAVGLPLPAKIVAVEVDRPHDVAVFAVGDADLIQGENAVRSYLRTLAECRASGKWPGRYETGEVPLDLPSWAFDDDGAEDPMGAGLVIGGAA